MKQTKQQIPKVSNHNGYASPQISNNCINAVEFFTEIGRLKWGNPWFQCFIVMDEDGLCFTLYLLAFKQKLKIVVPLRVQLSETSLTLCLKKVKQFFSKHQPTNSFTHPVKN